MSFFQKHRRTLLCVLCGVLALAMLASLAVLFIEKNRETDAGIHGGRAQTDANLRYLTVEETETGIALRFKFLSGTGDAAVPCGVPTYRAGVLPSPARLTVTFDDLAYCDYVIDGTPEDPSGLVFAMFRAQRENGAATFCFHLTGPVLVQATEGEELVLTLTKTETEPKTAFYLLADAYYDYLTGNLNTPALTPTLCDDYAAVLMISKPYETMEEAEKARDALLTGEAEGVNLRVVSLEAGMLPPYAENVDAAALLSESILSVNGAKTSLPLFFADARFLCWLPDQSSALFAKDEEGGERLYIADKSGMRRPLTQQCFATVIKARFSSDGSLLAFIEQAEDAELITLVTVADGTVRVLDGSAFEMPLGKTVMDLALNNDGCRLYCLSGDTIYSLREYDLTETTAVLLDTDVLVEGSIEYKDGYLYYCDVFDEREAVLRTETETNEEEPLAFGAVFTLSPDGAFVAYLSEDYDTAVRDLNLLDLATGTSVTVAQDVMTDEFFFDADSRRLYFMPQTDDEEFCYQIMLYDIESGKTATLAQSVNAVFFASDKADEIIVSVILQNNGTASPATYLADFTQIGAEEE